MRWYVTTTQKQILGRYPSKRTAIRFAVKRMRVGQYRNLYIISEEDYLSNRKTRAIKIDSVPENIDELVEDVEVLSEW